MSDFAAVPASLATDPILGLPLPTIWFGLVFFILGMFLFLDGFDFGVGALFATRERSEERELLLAAIGPFWDGNEVWLVVFGGALFAAFPPAYANLFSRHYLLMFAILGALILRGLSPEFYEQRHDERWQRYWGRGFVVGSVAAPFFLGVFVGNWVAGASRTLTAFGLLVGLATVALTVADGATYLGVKTRGDLRAELAGYAAPAVAVYLGLVVVALGTLAFTRPALRGVVVSPAIGGLVAASAGLGVVVVVGVRRERYHLAFAGVAALVFAFVGVAATLAYPAVDPAVGLSASDAAVSTLALNLTTVFAAVLLPLVLGYFVFLYSTFRGPASTDESY
ncbi:cytochrome d ubiquinol oxidase subunit II [Salinirarus marinus]|uniref:cytochrome d ubiquinol oxidase subunit II n=1 Tax=Salinirarus marinus TaxID=3068310 RepID=UPI003C6C17D4